MARNDGGPRLVAALQAGESIQFRPRGHSMKPLIKDNQLVTVAPVALADVKKGDILYAKVKGRLVLHLCSAVDKGRVQISNNHGFVNGWCGENCVYGRVVKVED